MLSGLPTSYCIEQSRSSLCRAEQKVTYVPMIVYDRVKWARVRGFRGWCWNLDVALWHWQVSPACDLGAANCLRIFAHSAHAGKIR